jgi:Mg-chelatase subunit ChlD
MTVPSKFDVAASSVRRFIASMHRRGLDRGMIASFGNTFRVDADFTTDPSQLSAAVACVGRSIGKEGTRFYDGLVDAATLFYHAGRRDALWLCIVLTDGVDSGAWRLKNPVLTGRILATLFNHDPTNFLTVIGVGRPGRIDTQALTQLGQAAGCPALHLDNFHLVERAFQDIAVQVTSRLVGIRHTVGNLSWDEIARIRSHTNLPVDYCFLLDRSGSMRESAATPHVTPTSAAGNAARFSLN